MLFYRVKGEKMYKSELIAKAAKVLSENNVRKPVHVDKRVLKIIDATYNNEDISGQVSIKPKDKMVKYTFDDVANILEAIIVSIQDAIQHGESVAIKGLGNFSVVWRNPRRVKHPDTGEWVEIEGRYAPKFSMGQPLINAARVFMLSSENNPSGFSMPDPVYDKFETPDEEYEDGDEINGDA